MFRNTFAQLTRRICLPTYGCSSSRWYQVGPNSARPGMVIDLNGSPQIVVSKEHGGTGRGQAVIKLSLKHAVTGVKSHERFRSNDSLEVMLMIQKSYQFLYADDKKANLMDMQTYEELAMDLDKFEGEKDKLAFLEDGMDVTVQVLEPEPGPISWRLPARHTYKVKSVESRIARDKGATYLPATLENGAKVSVPDFIKPGEQIIVDLEKAEYVGRA
ncbi:hypothetical protein LPJ73_002471 [Coemansia sp. RSA 2703]|nr:hypothetical protein LPJ73_002471 [Coemansia sp. RSA 2703]KAJ2362525.1 hypothetical protein IW150_006983 [Coemansia sp. RSA 2607]KAJ2384016.1 hypothetical protein GGI05_005135 [Coemansia sp. RSA 2603]